MYQHHCFRCPPCALSWRRRSVLLWKSWALLVSEGHCNVNIFSFFVDIYSSPIIHPRDALEQDMQ